MSDETPDQLIEGLSDGNAAAVERAFRAYEPYLRMAVRRQLNGALRSKLDSMDVVQSVWADVLSGLRSARWQFTDQSHLRAFLLRVARNRLIDRRRQYRTAIDHEQAIGGDSNEPPLAGSDPRPSEVAQGNELWARLMAECPPAHREILILKRQGLSLAEIAARTGMHEGSIRRLLYDLARRLSLARRTVHRSDDSGAELES